MRAILTIAGKDLLLLWRDRMGFFWWMIGFPLLIAVLIGAIFAGVVEGPSQPMSVAVVDEERSPASQAFVAALENSDALIITRLTQSDARDAVRRGRLAALVLLEKGFRISPALLWERRLPIAVGVDPARRAESAYLQAILKDAAIQLLRDQWPARNDQPPPAEIAAIETIRLDPNRVEPRSAFEICFPLGMIWGLLGLAAEFAMGLARERETGTLIRLRVAPIARLHLLAGNGLACFAASLGVMLFLLVVGRFVFGIRLQNPLVLAVALLSTAGCFVGITMLLSVLGRTESAVAGAAWACLLVMAMLGGGMVPQIFMPAWMETAGNLSPVKWAIIGLEGGIWRDLALADVRWPCAILLGQGAASGAVAATVLSRIER